MSNFITKDFEPSTAAAWKQKIQVDLKGADYNQTLLTNTSEGIVIKPFYHSDTFEKLEIPISSGDFKICQNIFISDEIKANSTAVESISNGVQALKFEASSPFNITQVFKNLTARNIDFHFNFGFLSETFVNELLDYLTNETVYINLDIVGNLAKTGNWFENSNSDFETVKNLISKNPSKIVLGVNVNHYQNSGANTVQQVAYALAHANEYLTKFGGQIASKIQFNFAIGSNYFFEISKLRAFTYLYNLIVKEYGLTSVPLLFSEPSYRNKTLYDFNVNMLRSTTECMSAILGGSNTVSNISYDALFHHSNNFGERIARNQLLVLKEESYFKNATQITSNTYYIESITKQIAEKALDIFKDIENSGGFLYQLKEGTIQRKISENEAKEQSQFDAGELVLLGTNKYPNEQDKMKNDLQKNPFPLPNPKKTLITPILAKRLAEKLELKRLENEA